MSVNQYDTLDRVTWFDSAHFAMILKMLKKNARAQLTVKTKERETPDYEINYSKDDNLWCIKEYIKDELISVQHKRRMRGWATHVEDVEVIYISHRKPI